MAISTKLPAIAQEISALIDLANSTTGAADTDLSEAVQRLCRGYGQDGEISAWNELAAGTWGALSSRTWGSFTT